MKRVIKAILTEDVRKVFNHFSSCFDIKVALWSPNEELWWDDIPQAELDEWNQPYCLLMQRKLYGDPACGRSDLAKKQEAIERGEMVVYRCHAGLVEVIKPVYLGRLLLGVFVTGQFRSEDEVPPWVMSDWSREHEPAELEAAYASLPCIPEKKIGDVTALFSVLADYVVSRHLITLKGSTVLGEILSYMEAHVQDDLSLDELAKLVGRSPSRITHLFTDKLGKSFKQTFTEIRLRKAEQYMSSNSDMRIGKIAAMVGYRDPLYFSRVYKEHRNVPPTEFVKRCRQNQSPTDGSRNL